MSRVIDAIIRLTDNFTQPMSKTIKTMTEASREGRRMRKSIEEAGKGISNVGSSLTKAITLPVAGVATACGKMAMDFEDGIAKVSTIADVSVMSLDKIKAGTLDLSNQLGVSVTEISEAQYNAISAGAATEKSLSVVGTAVKAAKAGFTDAATAVDGLTTVFNSFQGAVDYQAIADQMLLTQNYGKTTFGEMASSIGMVTPVANALNVSTEELFSSIAVLTKNGINTSSSITGLKAAYSNILKPTADASKAARELGLDFSATHLKAVGWAQFLAEVKEKTAGNTDALARLFGSVEALNSMTVLAGAGMEDFNGCLDQMGKAAGLTEQSYQKLLTPSERWAIAINKIKNAGITMGEKLLPVFERVTGIVEQAADRFNGLSDSQVTLAMKLAGAAAAAGPLVNVFGKMVSGSAGLLGVLGKVGKAAEEFKLGSLVKMPRIFSTTQKVAGALPSVLGKVFSKIPGMTGILGKVGKAAEGIKLGALAKMSGIFSAAGRAAAPLSGVLGKVFSKASGMASIFGKAGKAAGTFGRIMGGFALKLPFVQNTINVLGGSASLLKGAFAAVTSPVGLVVGALGALVAVAAVVVLNFDKFKASLGRFAPLFSELKSGFSQLQARMKPLVEGARRAGAVFKQAFQDTVIKAASGAVGAFGKIAKAALPVANGIVSVVEKIKFSSAAQGISQLGEHFQQLMQRVAPIAEKIGQILTIVFQVKLAGVFGAAIGFISGFATGIGTIIDGILTVFDGLITFVSGVFSGNWGMAWEGVKQIFTGIFEAIIGVAKGVVNGIAGAINGVIRAINGMGITIPDWVPGIGGKAFQLNIPEIPMLARGTDSWKGGLAQVHEKGGEIIDLPRGSRVYPHDESIRKAKEEGARSFVLEKLADQIIVREEADIDKIAQALLRRLRKASMNMGGVY